MARAAMRMSFDVFANEAVRMMKWTQDNSWSPAGDAAQGLSRTQVKVC